MSTCDVRQEGGIAGGGGSDAVPDPLAPLPVGRRAEHFHLTRDHLSSFLLSFLRHSLILIGIETERQADRQTDREAAGRQEGWQEGSRWAA